MRELIITIIIASTFLNDGMAQCDPQIPNFSNVKKFNGWVYLTGSQNWWVCRGLNVGFGAGEHTIFVEDSTEIEISQGRHTIYLKYGCKLVIYSDSNLVYYDSNATIIDSGNGNSLNVCLGQEYDYSTAPSQGCLQTTQIVHHRFAEEIKVYPNPFSSILNIEVKEEGTYNIQLMNLQGQIIKETESTSSFNWNIGDIENGMYLIRICQGGDCMQERIVKVE